MSIQNVFERHGIAEDKQKNLLITYDLLEEAIKQNKPEQSGELNIDTENLSEQLADNIADRLSKPEDAYFSDLKSFLKTDRKTLMIAISVSLIVGFILGKL